MASFPVVQATNQSTSASSTSHSVSLPSGIVSGNVLIVFFGIDNGATVSTPSGWSLVKDLASATRRLVCFSKVATGSEGSTLTVTTSSSFVAVHTSYRIASNTSTITVSTGTTGSDDQPNPDNLNNGTSGKYLWLAVGFGGTSSTITAYPSNYTNTTTANTSTFTIAAAARQLEALQENPGIFDMSASTTWVAYTVSLSPQNDVTVTAPLLTMASTIFATGISYGATGTSALLTMASSIFAGTVKIVSRADWTNQNKNTSTWTNQDHS